MQKDSPVKIFFKKSYPYLLIIAVGFLLYCHTLRFGFTYLDDNLLILDNQYFLKHLSNIITAFKEDVFFSNSDAYYRPILTLSFMLDAQLGGASAFMYHLSNILMHLAASCLVFLVLIKLEYKRMPALFFSLIFTAHPVLTQAVAWVPGRNDSLLAVFVLLSFVFYINFHKTKYLPYLIYHTIFFLLALFTKETAIALVPMCILYNYFILKSNFISRGTKGQIAAWAFVIALWLLARELVLRQQVLTAPVLLKSFAANWPVAIQVVGKLLLPLNLSVLPTIKDTGYVYGFVTIAFLIISLALSRNKQSGLVMFGFLWFAFFLLPTLLTHNPFLAFGIDYQLEHRVYLPMLGFIIMLLELDFIKSADFKKITPKAIGVLFIFIFSAITLVHSYNFKDRLMFWKNAVKTSPHSPLAHRNLGAMYYLDKKYDMAQSEYRKSLELNPREPQAHNNLGLIFMNKGQFKEAEQEYAKELENNPDYDDVHFNFGLLRYRQGRFKDAENLWLKTLEISPGYADAIYNLAVLYRDQKNYERVNYYLNQLKTKTAN